MTESASGDDADVKVEVQVTLCPACGTEWETVVTRRRVLQGSAQAPSR